MTDVGAAIVELGRSLYERGVTPGRTGNLSARIAHGYLMTPTNVSLGRLRADELSRLDGDGQLLAGPAPSKEWALHLACYRRDPDVGAVAHVHSMHATAVSMLVDLDPLEPIPPLTAYFAMRVGRLRLLPYFAPGAPELAEALAALPAGVSCALLANHGSIAAADLESAVDAVEEIEATARLHLLLAGRAIRPLTSTQADAIRK